MADTYEGQKDFLQLAKTLGFENTERMLRRMAEEKQAAREKDALYDLVFVCNSVKSLMPSGKKASGCELIVSSKLGAKILNGEVESRRVAVAGQYNAGKTWVLQNLFKFKFAQGSMLRTKGLSMKMDEVNKLLIIDSAGNLEPVSPGMEVADAVNDRKNVEVFNKEFLVDSADIVILVVNQLTWPEQENAQSMANRCIRNTNEGNAKVFIVVHNMPGVNEVDEARTMFKEQIHRCYKGVSVQHMSKMAETLEFIDESSPNETRHYGVANQYSQAGRKFNKQVFEEILKMIDHRCPVPKRHNMKDILEQTGKEVLPQFFFTEPTTSNDEVEGDEVLRRGSAMSLKFVPSMNEADIKENREQVYGNFEIQVLANHNINARNRGVSTALGDLGSVDLVWEPPVTAVIVEAEEGEDKMETKHITIEAPGCSMGDVDVESLDTGVLVVVRKPSEDAKVIGSGKLEDTRRYGTWKRLFEYVDSSGAQYDWNDDGFKVVDGIIHLELKRRNLEKPLIKAKVRADRATKPESAK